MLCLLVWTDKSINTSLRDGGNDWEIYNLNHFKFYFPCSFRGVSWWKWVIIWIFKRHLNDQCHQRRQQGILGETPFWDNLFSSPLTRTHVAHANIRKYCKWRLVQSSTPMKVCYPAWWPGAYSLEIPNTTVQTSRHCAKLFVFHHYFQRASWA